MIPLLIGAGIAAAGSVAGGLISKGGSDAAGAAYAAAAKNADYIRHRNEANLSPWFQSGQDAQNVISGLLGLGHAVPDGQGYGGVRNDAGNWQQDQENAFSKFQASPDYNFRQAEGVRALDRSAASKGMLLSGAQTKAAQDFGGNLASGEYGNWFNRLSGVGNQGLAAANGENSSNLAATGLQNAALGGQASAYQSGANALASGISSGANTFGSMLGSMGGGMGSMFGGGGVTAGAAPAGGYGGYAGYASTLPGFSSR